MKAGTTIAGRKRECLVASIVLALMLLLLSSAPAQFQRPPKGVLNALNAPPLPTVSISPDGTRMVPAQERTFRPANFEVE